MAGGIQDGKQKPPLPQAGSSFIERIAGQGEVGGSGSGAETWGHGAPLHRRSPIDLRPLPVVRSASTVLPGRRWAWKPSSSATTS